MTPLALGESQAESMASLRNHLPLAFRDVSPTRAAVGLHSSLVIMRLERGLVKRLGTRNKLSVSMKQKSNRLSG